MRWLYYVCRDSKIRTLKIPSVAKGTFILLKAILSKVGFACYSALGTPGKPAERVADEAVDQIFSFLTPPGCIDHYLADQLVLPLSIIPGKSAFYTNKLSHHLLTNAYGVQQFLPVKINIDEILNSLAQIEIEGMSL